ncbi:EamA family transporter [Agromyces intestinalis]|uniref:EamA family transporter n=1 Tax=Agromyces intestinalis TaxID=2592652 RepID=A0A5C1YHD6_9MICO|nr:SMR family transporter [Agromyces intestinalis]QEO14457.1 EamA family transporter [Agromyces intestinalis]
MSITALAIVLAAAVCHAAWNIVAHGVSRIGLPFLWWGAIASTVLWLPVVPFTGGLGAASPTEFAIGVIASAGLHCAYMLVLQRGYATGRLSTVYATARGTGPAITVLVAVLWFGERPTVAELAGIAVIIAGVVAIGLVDRGSGPTAPGGRGAEAGMGTDVTGPRRRLRDRVDPGLAWGLATGVGIAAYTLWDAQAVRTWGAAPVAYMVGTTLGEIVLFSALLGRRRRELVAVWRAHWPRVLAFGALSPLAYILVLAAMTMAPVSLVAPLREISVVLVSVFGVLVLREGRATWRVAASVAVVAGVVLMAT